MKQIVVIGDPIEHSLTPTVYNAAFQDAGLSQQYESKKLRIKTNDLEKFVNRIRKENISGANITIPHKTRIIQYLDRLTPKAELIQAVNVVYKKNNEIIGDNTDAIGFKNSLIEKNVEGSGKKVIILGAGGVARAIAFTLTNSGLKNLVLLNRTLNKAEELEKWIKENFEIKTKIGTIEDIQDEIQDTDILINCTPIGMKGKLETKSLVPSKYLHSNLIVIDIVYNPVITKLLNDAKKKDLEIIDGSRMFLHQAIASFELLTSHKPSISVMEKTLKGALR